MIRTLYHGTTQEGYAGICGRGFGDAPHVWLCSEPDYVYFFDRELLSIDLGMDDSDPSDIDEACVNQALQMALIAATVRDSRSCDLYVLRLTVDDEQIAVLPDESIGIDTDVSVCVHTRDLAGAEFEAYICRGGYARDLRRIYQGILAHGSAYLEAPFFTAFEETVIETCVLPHIDSLSDAIRDTLIGERIAGSPEHLRDPVSGRAPQEPGWSYGAQGM